MPSTFDFKSKVAVVTGAASGIGEATVQLFLRSGCSVLGVDIGPLRNEQLQAEAKSDTSTFAFYQGDLAAPTGPSDIVAACVRRFGPRIDVLANVAGIVDDFSTAESMSDSMLDRVIEVNLKAPMRLMREVLPKMTEGGGGGAIVNVSSKAGTSGAGSGLAYAASKHGLIGATTNTAWMMRDKKVRCNAICPGAVSTNMKTREEDLNMEGFLAAKPVLDLIANEQRPPMAPLEIANGIVFLASDLAASINGAVLPIDRAWSTL